MKYSSKLLPAAVLTMMLAMNTLAATVTVTVNADSGAGTLRQAITDAADGDTIVFSLGAGNETLALGAELAVTKSLTIDGANAGGSGVPVTVQVTVPGTSAWRVFNINAAGKSVNISAMTVKGGDIGASYGYGGAIYHQAGTLNLDSMTVTESKAGYGGGIASKTNIINISNCTIISNTASCANGGMGGGIFLDQGANLTMNNTTLQGNTAGTAEKLGVGGGLFLYNDTTAMILNSTISGNAVLETGLFRAGGGIECQSFSRLDLVNTIVVSNMAAHGPDIRINPDVIACSYYSWHAQLYGTITTQATAPSVTNEYTAGDLSPLAGNGGSTMTMKLSNAAPGYQAGAFVYYNAGDGYYIQANDASYRKLDGSYAQFSPANPAADRINFDQRGAERIAPVSIGAYDRHVMFVLGANGAMAATGTAPSLDKGTDFGAILWGNVVTNTFSITNSGDAVLTVSGFEVSDVRFQIAGMPAAVDVGAVSNFTVAFAPPSGGAYTAALQIVVNNATNKPYIVCLAGMGARHDQAALVFEPASPQTYNTTNNISAAGGSGSGAVSYAVISGPGEIIGVNGLKATSGTGTIVVRAAKAADNDYNEAAVTAQVVCAKADQTIAFPVIPDQAIGATVNLAATATSGLTVRFAASGPATISGGTVLSVTGPGVVSVTASQAGNADWNAAPDVPRSFKVLPAPPSGVSASAAAYLDKVRVAWNAAAGVDSYQVWRNTVNNSGSASQIGTTAGTAYNDFSVGISTTYYYWVKAVNDAAGVSPFSAAAVGFPGVVGPLVGVNGLIGDNAQVARGTPLTIGVAMMNVPASLLGLDVDWWMLLHAQDDEIWYYINQAMELVPFDGNLDKMRPLYQGPLGNLPPYVMAQGVILPPGVYNIWFGVDYPMNGILRLIPGYYLESRLTLTVE